MSEIEKKWYVLRAISGKEAKVREYLEADIKNSDLGDYVSQVLIPTEKVYQVRNRSEEHTLNSSHSGQSRMPSSA